MHQHSLTQMIQEKPNPMGISSRTTAEIHPEHLTHHSVTPAFVITSILVCPECTLIEADEGDGNEAVISGVCPIIAPQ